MKGIFLALALILPVMVSANPPGKLEPVHEPFSPAKVYDYEKPAPAPENRYNWTLRCYTVPGEFLENGQPVIICDIIYTPRRPYD